MNTLRISNYLFYILWREQTLHARQLIVNMGTLLSRCGVLIILYSYVIAARPEAFGGATLAELSWGFFFYFLFLILGTRGISQMIMSDVRSGSIELLLARPLSYLQYRMVYQIGAGAYPFLVLTIVGGLGLAATVGVPEAMLHAAFAFKFILLATLGMFLSLLVYSTLGLVSFWIEDINPLRWIVDKAVMILGGAYIPVSVLPASFQTAALWSPFGAMYMATRLSMASGQAQWVLCVISQVLWIILALFLVRSVARRCFKIISVNGG
jgi:ABC-2 type transport system permease protein